MIGVYSVSSMLELRTRDQPVIALSTLATQVPKVQKVVTKTNSLPVAPTPWGTGGTCPHFYKWLGAGAVSRRTANKKLTKLY